MAGLPGNIMSISGLGLYSANNLDEAIPLPASQQAKAAIPPAAADQQAGAALSEANYQPAISAYGQAQNALAYLHSTVQGMDQSAHSGDATSGSRSGSSAQGSNPFRAGDSAAATVIDQVMHATRSFVDAYNANGAGGSLLASALNSSGLTGIGITRRPNGTLSLDAQTLQNALASNPGEVAQVFSAVASQVQANAQQSTSPSRGTVRQAASQPSGAQAMDSQLPPNVALNRARLAAQYGTVSRLG